MRHLVELIAMPVAGSKRVHQACQASLAMIIGRLGMIIYRMLKYPAGATCDQCPFGHKSTASAQHMGSEPILTEVWDVNKSIELYSQISSFYLGLLMWKHCYEI